MSLNLKPLIAEVGAKQTDLAAHLGCSPAGVAQLVNHGQWPKSADKAVWKASIESWLRERGASEMEISSAFKKATGLRANVAPSDEASSLRENTEMVLRKQGLSQAAKKHWGLFCSPFEADISSGDQVYMNPDLRYAREAMWQTARNGGFLAVVGESGAGKSTLRRDLLERVDADRDKTIVVEPYVLGMEDNDAKGKTLRASHIAEAIMAAVAPLAKRVSSPEARFRQLHNALKESAAAGHRHCLLIEEAHSLSIPTLKHLKRFFELEHGFRKLLSIILIGQPELKAKLNERDPQVREVVQRCEVVDLLPLSGPQLPEYIAHKLGIAGKKAEEIIAGDAIEALRGKLVMPSRQSEAAISRAYPLAVNNLMTTLLNEAAALGAVKIDAALVREV